HKLAALHRLPGFFDQDRVQAVAKAVEQPFKSLPSSGRWRVHGRGGIARNWSDKCFEHKHYCTAPRVTAMNTSSSDWLWLPNSATAKPARTISRRSITSLS